tara:strand:- start:17038 stop:18516 length:1479 start_codon:yes stop_codon:yes gene_type:complete
MNNINNEKKKKSVKKEFSDSINIDEHTFQTMHMENKLKKIKRRKKIKNNFKNMETFETLQNTFENDEKKEERNDNIESFNNIVEGLDIDITDTENRDTWEGHDDVDAPDMSSFDWKKELINGINYIYDSTQEGIRVLADKTTSSLSNGEATENDRIILYNYFSTIIAALATYPVSYNWYFLMFYLQDMTDVDLPHVSTEELKILSTVTDPEELKEKWYVGMLSLFMWFNEFAIFFPATLDWFITVLSPPIINKFLDGKVKFMLLFFIVFNILKYGLTIFKDLFISIIDETSNSWIVNTMYASVFLLFFIAFFRSLNDPGTKAAYMSSWFIMIPMLFVRFIIIIVTSVPLAGALCFLYLFIYSLFATILYKPAGSSYLDLIKRISYHIDNSKLDKPPRSCDGESFFSKLLRIVVNIVGVFKDNLLEITIVLISIGFYYNSLTEMSDAPGIMNGYSLKECIGLLFILIAIYGGTQMYLKLIPEFKRIFIEGVQD